MPSLSLDRVGAVLRHSWKTKLRDRPGLRRVLIVATVFWAIALILSLHRYHTLYASYDQGIFNQVFWNNSHGRLFQSSLSSALSSSVVHDGDAPEVFYRRLGQHFTPALLLWVPFYILHPQAVTLVFLQVTLITAGGLVLYLLARQHLPPMLSAWIASAYYAANAVIGPVFSNFHDISQIPLFTFTLLLAMEKRLWWLFWLMAGLTLIVREDAGIGLFGIGVYMVLSRRFPRAGVALCTIAFGYILTCTNVFMPAFSEDISKRFMIERFGQYVDSDEATTLDVLKAMLSQPWLVLWEFVNPPLENLKYLLGQWLPFAFVPAISPASWAIAGFPLLKIFSQQGESATSINIRYALGVVPGLAYGTILWWAQHGDRFRPPFKRWWLGFMVASVFFSFTSSPHRVLYFLIPDSFDPWVYVSLPRQWSHVRHINHLMAQIPDDSSVSATTYLIPKLSSRRAIIRLPWYEYRGDDRQIHPVDYLFADLWRTSQYQVAFKSERNEFRNSTVLFDQKTAAGEYGVIGVEDGVALLQRGVPSDPAAAAAWLALRAELQPILEALPPPD